MLMSSLDGEKNELNRRSNAADAGHHDGYGFAQPAFAINLGQTGVAPQKPAHQGSGENLRKGHRVDIFSNQTG